MIKRIKSMALAIASFIWSLPGFLKYPLIAILVVGLPSVVVVIAILGGSFAVAVSPAFLVIIILWYLANQVDK